MRHTALAPLRDTLLLALGLGGCAPRATGAPPADDGRPVAAQTSAQPGPTATDEGYVREEDGTVHRAGAQTCVASNPRPACSDPGGHNASTCTLDADCQDGPNPRCVQDSGQVGPFCQCDYSCARDSDCKAGELCVCGEALGGDHHSMCVTALCQQDSACASGVCGVSVYHNGCSEERLLACRTEQDTCKRDADCGEGQACVAHGPDRTWSCQGITCIIGRPLLADGAARTAPGVARDDWHDERARPDLVDLVDPDAPLDASLDTTLDAATAAALAAHWQAVAALEHASVASFARFTLELLAHAAPPGLLADAQRAALDEIAHARLAFTLASRFAGCAVGPGPLPTADLVTERPLAAFVAALVEEGCVGETLGAAEAELLASHADPRLAPRLLAVAADETRHAALAWRTLHWLIARHGEPVRQAARVAMAASAARLAADPDPGPELAAPAWGLMPREQLVAHRRRTLAAVIDPLLAAVLDGSTPAIGVTRWGHRPPNHSA